MAYLPTFPVPLGPSPSNKRGTSRSPLEDERCDNTMRGNLDAVSKLWRIDGIDESRIFSVSSLHSPYIVGQRFEKLYKSSDYVVF